MAAYDRLARLAVAAAVAGLATACAARDPVGTASGRLDVTMQNVDRACVREDLLNTALSGGWSLKSTSDLQIVVQRPAPPSFAAAMLSTAYGPPQARMVWTLIPAGQATRAMVEMIVVSNAGTPFERTQEVAPTGAQQRELQDAARRGEAKCARK